MDHRAEEITRVLALYVIDFIDIFVENCSQRVNQFIGGLLLPALQIHAANTLFNMHSRT
jgi:hypothetical protein